jgi:hypothetical protein
MVSSLNQETPIPYFVLGCKHLSLTDTHFKAISGETAQYLMGVVLPSGLPGGPIVLEALLELQMT